MPNLPPTHPTRWDFFFAILDPQNLPIGEFCAVPIQGWHGFEVLECLVSGR